MVLNVRRPFIDPPTFLQGVRIIGALPDRSGVDHGLADQGGVQRLLSAHWASVKMDLPRHDNPPKTLIGRPRGALFMSSQLSADPFSVALDRIHIAHLSGGAHRHA